MNHFLSSPSIPYPTKMVKRNKFKGCKLDVSFPLTCVKSDVFDGNDTDLAPYLNRVLPRDAQNNILRFLGSMRIRNAWYEDSMYYDESMYCVPEYDDDFTIYEHSH